MGWKGRGEGREGRREGGREGGEEEREGRREGGWEGEPRTQFHVMAGTIEKSTYRRTQNIPSHNGIERSEYMRSGMHSVTVLT